MTNIVITLTNITTGDVFSGVVEVHTDLAATYWKGFALVLILGLSMLGARWVRQIIGGSSEE